jgi:azobenzene reductase
MSKKIVLICGSMNKEHSLTKLGLKEIEKILNEKGHVTNFIEVKDLNLPIFEPKYVKQPPNAIKNLVEIIKESNALIVGSPEYHGGYSGAIKNLIDYLTGDLLRNKPIALLSAAGGYRSGINTLNGLRLVFRSLYARVIAEQVAISAWDIIEDEQENIQFIEPISEKINEVVDGLIKEIYLVERLIFSS